MLIGEQIVFLQIPDSLLLHYINQDNAAVQLKLAVPGRQAAVGLTMKAVWFYDNQPNWRQLHQNLLVLAREWKHSEAEATHQRGWLLILMGRQVASLLLEYLTLDSTWLNGLQPLKLQGLLARLALIRSATVRVTCDSSANVHVNVQVVSLLLTDIVCMHKLLRPTTALSASQDTWLKTGRYPTSRRHKETSGVPGLRQVFDTLEGCSDLVLYPRVVGVLFQFANADADGL